MESNIEEALRAKEHAEKLFALKDFAGARSFALKAQMLCPQLEGISHTVATFEIFAAAEKKINGEVDFYSVLGLDPSADMSTLKNQYRKMAVLLHPDKNKIVGADEAFKLVSEAWTALSDSEKRVSYDHRRNKHLKRVVDQSNFLPVSVTTHDTFWTVCTSCQVQYEYLRKYINKRLSCKNCRGVFIAVETGEAPMAYCPWSPEDGNRKRSINKVVPLPSTSLCFSRNGASDFNPEHDSEYGQNLSFQWNSSQSSLDYNGYMPNSSSVFHHASGNNSGANVNGKVRNGYNETATADSFRPKRKPGRPPKNLKTDVVADSCLPNRKPGRPPKDLKMGTGDASRSQLEVMAWRTESDGALVNGNLNPGHTPNVLNGYNEILAADSCRPKRKPGRPPKILKMDAGDVSQNGNRDVAWGMEWNAVEGNGNASAKHTPNVSNGYSENLAAYSCGLKRKPGRPPKIFKMDVGDASRNGPQDLAWSTESGGAVVNGDINAQLIPNHSMQGFMSSMRFLSDPAFDARKLLIDKARTVILNKLEDMKSNPEEQKDVNLDVAKSCDSPRSGLDNPVSESELKLEPMPITVPDPDFHDFDRDRSEECFRPKQIWALYDEEDGMPRLYCLIRQVISVKPFLIHISYLSSKTDGEFGSMPWIYHGFTKSCGSFRVFHSEPIDQVNIFSHLLSREKAGRGGLVRIYPRRGDIWAVYRNWSSNWNKETPKEVRHQYEMVEVLDDYSEDLGVCVTPLVKLEGYKTVYQRNSNKSAIRWIPKREMMRFSHQVPSCLLKGEELNLPEGCWDLDPAAIPEGLLQTEEKQSQCQDQACS